MNEHDVESLLSGLQPRAPSAALTRQVSHELELDRQWMRQPARAAVPRWKTPVLWSGLGAAAAALIMGFVSNPATIPASGRTALAEASANPPQIMPVSTIREVVGARDEGIRYNTATRLPEQHLKVVSRESHAWIDPRDGAQITVEMPREDSVILPVSFQ
ncbi:MAG TPA: hypothetical protein VGE29_22040 [Prosthecobacter sp.]